MIFKNIQKYDLNNFIDFQFDLIKLKYSLEQFSNIFIKSSQLLKKIFNL